MAKNESGTPTSNDTDVVPQSQNGLSNGEHETNMYDLGGVQLCQRCAALDWQTILTPPRLETEERTRRRIADLGRLDDEDDAEATCPSCILFRSVKTKGLPVREMSGTYALMQILDPVQGKDVRQKDELVGSRDERQLEAWTLSVVDNHLATTRPSGSISGIIMVTSLLMAENRNHAHDNLRRVRQIDARRIDYLALRDFIVRCDNGHEVNCGLSTIKIPVARNMWRSDRAPSPPTIQPPQRIKLIDCEMKVLIRPQEAVEYIALSYAWGDVDEKLYALASSASTSASSSLAKMPLTVEDAMEVTRKIGHRYIWVDRYCINQDDADELEFHAQQMHSIYFHAQAVIVAAAGDDCNYGLPGVSSTPRSPQPILDIGSHRLISSMGDPHKLISQSRWASRAWTYQEHYYSRRRLIFTDQQVMLECGQSTVSETIPVQGAGRSSRLLHHLSLSERSFAVDIWASLAQFTSKELRFDRDAIRAFQGYINDYIASNEQAVVNMHGLPASSNVFQLTLDATNESMSVAQRMTTSFLGALCWRSKNPGRRRAHFPSWSWAGWTAHLNASNLAECNTGVEPHDGLQLEIAFEGRAGDLHDFKDLLSGVAKPAEIRTDMLSQFIHVTGWTMEFEVRRASDKDLLSKDDLHSWKGCSLLFGVRNSGPKSEYLVQVDLLRLGTTYAPLYVLDQAWVEEILKRENSEASELSTSMAKTEIKTTAGLAPDASDAATIDDTAIIGPSPTLRRPKVLGLIMGQSVRGSRVLTYDTQRTATAVVAGGEPSHYERVGYIELPAERVCRIVPGSGPDMQQWYDPPVGTAMGATMTSHVGLTSGRGPFKVPLTGGKEKRTLRIG